MSYQKTIFNLIKAMSGQGGILTIPRLFVDITGDLYSALMLSQCIYWTDKTKNADGWFYKSNKEWQDELGMTKYRVTKSTERLVEKKLIETKLKKADGAPTTHYKVDQEALVEAISNEVSEDSIYSPSANPITEGEQNDLANVSKSITETTQKTTTKNTKDSTAATAGGNAPLFRNMIAELDKCYGPPYALDDNEVSVMSADVALKLMKLGMNMAALADLHDYVLGNEGAHHITLLLEYYDEWKNEMSEDGALMAHTRDSSTGTVTLEEMCEELDIEIPVGDAAKYAIGATFYHRSMRYVVTDIMFSEDGGQHRYELECEGEVVRRSESDLEGYIMPAPAPTEQPAPKFAVGDRVVFDTRHGWIIDKISYDFEWVYFMDDPITGQLTIASESQLELDASPIPTPTPGPAPRKAEKPQKRKTRKENPLFEFALKAMYNLDYDPDNPPMNTIRGFVGKVAAALGGVNATADECQQSLEWHLAGRGDGKPLSKPVAVHKWPAMVVAWRESKNVKGSEIRYANGMTRAELVSQLESE